MRSLPLLACLLLLCSCRAVTPAADADGFVPLFNGRNLDGWININCAPETWSVRDGVIACTGKPVGALRTVRQYENFILEAEWRHLERSGNSGIFVWGTPISAPGVPFLRGIEVQALDHGYAEDFEKKNGKKSDWFTVHGDVFAIHGASMKPLPPTNGKRSFPRENRSKPSPEWNHYRIEARNGSLRLHVNGREVSGGDDIVYRKGYLALESEGARVEFRNLKIKELPSTGAGPDVTAPLDPGWQPLFTGLDLRGWTPPASAPALWSVAGEKIAHAANAAAAPLWTVAEYGAAEIVFDYRAEKGAAGALTVLVRGDGGAPRAVALPVPDDAKFHRYTVTVQGASIRWQRGDADAVEVPLPAGTPPRGHFGLAPAAAKGVFMNLHVRQLL